MQNKLSWMYNPQNYSKILWYYFDKFMLSFGDKKVPTPYRINLPYQSDRRKYGKFNPFKLRSDTKKIAFEQGINLDNLSSEEIRTFMEKNQLGIDCSGFVYQMLNFLLNKLKKGNMRKNGFPKASSTNVRTLVLDKYTVPINKVTDIHPGDIIGFNKGAAKLAHVLIVMEMGKQEIVYTHSTSSTKIEGVQIGRIIITDPQKSLKYQRWEGTTKNGQPLGKYLDETSGDGVRRLRALL